MNKKQEADLLTIKEKQFASSWNDNNPYSSVKVKIYWCHFESLEVATMKSRYPACKEEGEWVAWGEAELGKWQNGRDDFYLYVSTEPGASYAHELLRFLKNGEIWAHVWPLALEK